MESDSSVKKNYREEGESRACFLSLQAEMKH